MPFNGLLFPIYTAGLREMQALKLNYFPRSSSALRSKMLGVNLVCEEEENLFLMKMVLS